MPRKACTKCGKTKPLEDFPRRSEVPDGRGSHCKACRKAEAAIYYRKNREHILKQTGAYQKAHLQQAARYMREWRSRNPEKDRTRMHEYIARDPVAWRARAAAWDKANPDRVRMRATRRYTRQKNAFVQDVNPDLILQRDLGICGICDEPITGPFHIDHIVPLATEGKHEPNNCQLAHPLCNQRKSSN